MHSTCHMHMMHMHMHMHVCMYMSPSCVPVLVLYITHILCENEMKMLNKIYILFNNIVII